MLGCYVYFGVMLFSCSYDCWFDFRFGLWRIVAGVWVALQVFAVVCCVRVFELWMLVVLGLIGVYGVTFLLGLFCLF